MTGLATNWLLSEVGYSSLIGCRASRIDHSKLRTIATEYP